MEPSNFFCSLSTDWSRPSIFAVRFGRVWRVRLQTQDQRWHGIGPTFELALLGATRAMEAS